MTGRPRAVWVLAIGASVFALLALRYWSFTIDDAFITYRFAEHLVEGHGLVWNVGEDPAEGYSSPVWMMTSAAALLAQIDPVAFSKGAGLVAAVMILWILASHCRALPLSLVALLVAGLATNPAFVFLSVQGLETSLAGLLITVIAVLAVRAATRSSHAILAGLLLSALLSALTRPETLVLSGVVLAGLLRRYATEGNWAAVRRTSTWALAAILLGLAYLSWKLSYFGAVLPTTAHIKMGGGIDAFRPDGLSYVLAFAFSTVLPYALVLLGRRPRRDSPGWILILGCLAFWGTMALIDPVQGFLGRFAIPVLPAFLVGIAGTGESRWPGESKRIASALILLALSGVLAGNLHRFLEADRVSALRDTSTREMAGKALAGIDGVMFTTAAGALPYYSGWRSADMLGLTSRRVALDGVTKAFLTDLAPDLIIMRTQVPGSFEFRRMRHLETKRYLLEEGFVAVLALPRGPDHHLLFFGRNEPSFLEAIAERLLPLAPQGHARSLRRLLEGSGVPVLKRPAATGLGVEATCRFGRIQ